MKDDAVRPPSRDLVPPAGLEPAAFAFGGRRSHSTELRGREERGFPTDARRASVGFQRWPAGEPDDDMTTFTKSPGWDWLIDYEDEDGTVETMSVFGMITIEDAILEARRSLSFNFFKNPDFVAPAVVGARRT